MKSCQHIFLTGLFGFLFLALFKTGLLYHLEQYSLFCPKADYLRSFFEQPGGVLALAGAFLTQFCHYPVLGAAVFALLLCLLCFLTEKAFGLEGKAAWLSVIPALFLLLFITRMDYSIYLFRTYGLLFSQVLGFWSSCTESTFWGDASARSSWRWPCLSAIRCSAPLRCSPAS